MRTIKLTDLLNEQSHTNKRLHDLKTVAIHHIADVNRKEPGEFTEEFMRHIAKANTILDFKHAFEVNDYPEDLDEILMKYFNQ